MAPLPSNNTGVVFLDYGIGGENHTMQMRYGDSSSSVDIMGIMDEFLTALGTGIYEITILGARHRAKDADITLPVTWTGEATYGEDTADHANSAWYLDFIGRSVAGRRARVSLFGSKSFEDNINHDYRLDLAGGTLDAWTVLDSAADMLCAIDGEAIVWYTYLNVGVNAYWRNKIR